MLSMPVITTEVGKIQRVMQALDRSHGLRFQE